MVFHKNNFAGQIVGSAVTTTNSASSGDAFSLVNAGSGTITYASDPSSGSYASINLTPASSTSCFVRDTSFNSTQIALSDCFYYSGVPTGNLKIHQVATAAGYAATVIITTSGMLRLSQYGGGTVATASVALVVGHWYRIETQVLSDASAGSMACQWYVDNSTTQTGSLSASGLNTRGGAITQVDRGPNSPADTTFYTSWYYTNLQAQDGTTTPIGAYVSSNQPPVANAGANQTNIEPYTTVTHTGSGTDSDGTISSYVWTQTGGSPIVSLSGATTPTMNYVAPGTLSGATLTFQLTVTDDANATNTATVQDTIYPVTERAVMGGVEVPANTRSVTSSMTQTNFVWTAESGNLVRRVASQDNFVYGVTKPDATNTGWVPPANPTTITATRTTITTDNTVYQDTIFVGEVWVQAKNVQFINCWFRGQQTADQVTDPLVRCHWNTSQNTQFYRCTIGDPNQVGWPDCGILGYSFTADRCNIQRSSDGVRNVNADTATNIGDWTVKGCYIHDLLYFWPNAAAPDNQSHNDCVQLGGGQNITVVGNTLHAYIDTNLGKATDPSAPINTDSPAGPRYAWMTPLIVTPNYCAVDGLTFDSNWLEGGDFQVNIVGSKAYTATGAGLTITNNRFDWVNRRLRYQFGVDIAMRPYTTVSGNVDYNGNPVTINGGT